MKIKVRRYHLLLTLSSSLLLTAVATFSRERSSTLKEELAIAPAAVVVPAAALQPPAVPAVSAPSNPKPASAGRTAPAKRIALTFDDGPHPGMTQKLLALLRRERVTATFFIVGAQAEKYPELVQAIARDGHELANHTYSHRDVRRLDREELESELDRTDRAVQAVTHLRTKYFRPPGGRYDAAALKTAESLGYRMILWSSLAGDHLHPPARLIAERVLRSAQKEGVVLLHSGVETTLEALPGIIAALRDRGYTLATLSGMNVDDHILAGGRREPPASKLASIPRPSPPPQ